MPSLDEEHEALRFVFLQWATAGFAKGERAVEKERENKDAAMASEWFETISLQSSVGKMHDVRTDIAVHSFTTELPCSSLYFHISGFLWRSALKGSRVHE